MQKRWIALALAGAMWVSPMAHAWEQIAPKGVSQFYNPNAVVQVQPQGGQSGGDETPAPQEDVITQIQYKDRNDLVKQAQMCLIRLGYLQGGADGIFGKDTLTAVQQYQADEGYDATGVLTLEQLEHLEKRVSSGEILSPRDNVPDDAVVVTKGSKGEPVKEVQRMLIKMGFLRDIADGLYGSGTVKAVSTFQRLYGLEETGVVTGKTYRALKEAAHPESIVSLSAFINVFNGAELIAGTWVQLEMPQIPPEGGNILCPVDEYTTLTLTVKKSGDIIAIRVDSKLDGFAEAEASVMNAYNGVLAGCGITTTMEDSRRFLKKMGAYGEALNEDGLGVHSENGLRYEWQGDAGRLCFTVEVE